MRARLRQALNEELGAARAAEAAGDLRRAFAHLERAHVLAQRHAWAHAGVHMRMVRLGWLQRSRREVLGQLPRIVAALLFSRLWVPAGNTGGVDVSAFRPMPIADDLRAVLEQD